MIVKAVCIGILLLIAPLALSASTPALWSSSNNYKTGQVSLVTSSSTKSGSYSGTFPAAFTASPSFVVGVFKMDGPAGDVMEWTISKSSLSSSGFSVTWSVGSSTTINIQSMYYLGIDPTIKALGTFWGASFTANANMNLINKGTGYRQTYRVVNFTANSGETLDLTHRTIILVFINSILVKRNGGDFNVTVWATIDSPNLYTLYTGTSGVCTVHAMTYSRVTFDQTALQATQLTYIDSGSISGSSNTWSMLTLAVPYSSSTNFMAGLTSFAYPGTSVVNFQYNHPALTCTGTMSFQFLQYGYLNYRYRGCPAGYPYFQQSNNLCYDVCDPYYYGNTTAALCLPCGFGCYTCSNTTPTTCLSCNATIDFRVLSGTSCACLPGYYSTGAKVCVACMSTCATCTNGTACTSCDPLSFRTLTSWQCPCSTGYTATGSTCSPCSLSLTGCTSCTSTTVCVVCNASANLVLSSGKCVCAAGYYPSGATCLACSAVIPGCTTCTSSSICTACNSTAKFSLSGGICVCAVGTYLSGSSCLSCGTGCLACTSPTACTSCNTTAFFSLVGGVCSCQSGYYPSGVSCSACTSISGCLTCNSSAYCLTCNASKQLTASAGACVCINGYYMNSGSCSLCSTVLTYCSSCSSASTCTNCSSPFALIGTTCGCGTAYYTSAAGCVLCSSVMTGCLTCTGSATCTTCDVAGNFIAAATGCMCKGGYYPSGSSCLPCSQGCIDCTSPSSCITCDVAAFYVFDLLGGCVCDTANNYIVNGSSCASCSSLLAGCIQCSSAVVCTKCNVSVVGLSLFGSLCTCPANYTYNSATQLCEVCLTCCQAFEYLDTTLNLPDGQCMTCSSKFPNCLTCNFTNCSSCSSGYFLNITSGLCQSCGLSMPGCLFCTSGSICTSCNTTQLFVLTGQTCTCTTGNAIDVTNTCVPCTDTLSGCLACSSQTVCTSCDIAVGFIANASACDCQMGMYQSSVTSCSLCTMTGCLDCTNPSICVSCDASLLYVLTGSTCSCITGYYADLSGNCLACDLVLLGCTSCTDSSTCLSCDASQFLELLPGATACSCIQSFYQSGTVCLACPVGCTSCDSTGSCLVCNSTAGFEINGAGCSCVTGMYPVGTGCHSCSTTFEFCTDCTAVACNACASPTIVDGTGKCVCPSNYFNNSIVCQLCSTQFLGCGSCTKTNCIACDTASHFIQVGGLCVCDSGYVMVASQCASCGSLMNGCGTCSTPAICDGCDASGHYVMQSGSCICMAGFFMNSTLDCDSCISVLDGCATCTDSSSCTTCIPGSNYQLNANGTCSCIQDYVRSGPNCISCLVNCVCVGYQLSGGACLPICGDGITIEPTEQCDDGNNVAGDGCSPTCTKQSNYTCLVHLKLTLCSYSQPLNMSVNNITKDPSLNTLTFSINISPALTALDQIDFSNIIQTDLPLYNMRYTYNNGVLELTYDYDRNMHMANGTFLFSPSEYGAFFATPNTNFSFTIDPANNIPAIVYDNDTYEQSDTIKHTYEVATYTSYGLLIIGMFCDKVIGVELFGVLQLAYLCVSDINNVHPLLSPLMNMSIVNGYNPPLIDPHTHLPRRVKAIGYRQEFLNNFSMMFALILVEIVAALGVLAAGSVLPAFRSSSKTIAKRMLKEYLMMLVAFNSLNIAYSVGLQSTYDDGDLKAANIVAALCALILPISMAVVLIATNRKEFGEFSGHYRKNINCQLYFAVTLLYRLVLGATLSHQNDVEQSTISNVFIGILFLLYLLANAPYKKAYHNYRAVLCQATGLVILSVTMYYRSMKSNTPADVAFRIMSPALLEVVMIFLCIGASAACLGYELYLKFQKKPDIDIDDKHAHIIEARHQTEMNLNDSKTPSRFDHINSLKTPPKTHKIGKNVLLINDTTVFL